MEIEIDKGQIIFILIILVFIVWAGSIILNTTELLGKTVTCYGSGGNIIFKERITNNIFEHNSNKRNGFSFVSISGKTFHCNDNYIIGDEI